MGQKHILGPVDAIKNRMVFCVDGHDVVIFRTAGEIYAVGNVCAHQHVSRLHEGELDNIIIECPMHGWKYDIRTGQSLTGDGRVAVYAVRIVDGNLVIEM